MKSTEFRRGNLIMYENTTHVIDVIDSDLIKTHWIRDKMSTYSHEYKDIEPLPLTGEWLIKFEFTSDEISWYYSLDYDKEKETFKVFELPDKSGYGVINVNGFGICIKYVHPLQNLYFALTGKELTLK